MKTPLKVTLFAVPVLTLGFLYYGAYVIYKNSRNNTYFLLDPEVKPELAAEVIEDVEVADEPAEETAPVEVEVIPKEPQTVLASPEYKSYGSRTFGSQGGYSLLGTRSPKWGKKHQDFFKNTYGTVRSDMFNSVFEEIKKGTAKEDALMNTCKKAYAMEHTYENEKIGQDIGSFCHSNNSR